MEARESYRGGLCSPSPAKNRSKQPRFELARPWVGRSQEEPGAKKVRVLGSVG